MMPEEETPPVSEEPEESQLPEPTAPEATKEPATATEPEQFDWSPYQNADHLAGKSVQDLINYQIQRDQQFGRQTHELGELRSYKERQEALLRQAQGQPQKPAEPTKMTEYETAAFLQKLQEQPRAAVSEFMVPQLAEQLTPLVMKNVNQQLGPALQDQAQHVAIQQEYASLIRNHPEIQTDHELRWVTSELLGPNYLNGSVSMEQAMFLAKLGKEEASLFPVTCQLMRRGIPFDEAKEFAMLKQNAPANAVTKKQQLKEEVSGLRGGAKTSTKKVGTTEPNLETMDDVLESMAE
jgi:hypothetical protein